MVVNNPRLGMNSRVAHRLICMVSLVILKCITLVIQFVHDVKVNWTLNYFGSSGSQNWCSACFVWLSAVTRVRLPAITTRPWPAACCCLCRLCACCFCIWSSPFLMLQGLHLGCSLPASEREWDWGWVGWFSFYLYEWRACKEAQ